MKYLILIAVLLMATPVLAETFAIDTAEMCADYQNQMNDIGVTLNAFNDKLNALIDKQVKAGCVSPVEESVVEAPVKISAATLESIKNPKPVEVINEKIIVDPVIYK
jgi:hypothetical protein